MMREHIVSILFTGLLVAIFLYAFRFHESAQLDKDLAAIRPYLNIPFIDFDNPEHRALFKETLNLFHPGTPAANDSLLSQIEAYRQARFVDPRFKTRKEERGLSAGTLARLGGMYLQFLAVYVVVFLLTLYGAESLGTFRFVKMKQGRESYLKELLDHARGTADRNEGLLTRSGHAVVLLVKASLRGLAYLVLFSPGYVVGYALKTRMETDSVLFMILIGTVSNGVLITYANRFFTLLLGESRKGYVETALAKGLSGSFEWGVQGGIPRSTIIRPWKSLPEHVFSHILLSARYQYVRTLKEQGAFLISGLIIIEMALNIQGRLCYEMLQQLFYRQYDVALVIMFGIFIAVKATDIGVDSVVDRASRKYENRS